MPEFKSPTTPLPGARIIRRESQTIRITPAEVDLLQKRGAPRDLVDFLRKHVPEPKPTQR